MKRRLFCFFFFTICFFLTAEDAEKSKGEENKLAASAFNANAQVAMSSPGYLVTAGDVYTLSYAAGSLPVSYTILVDTTYRIRVSNLGILDASGKTFIELKNDVEKIVSKNYPMSGVQFVLMTPAVFTVSVVGEVSSAQEHTAWPLSRLSSIVTRCVTAYSSVRDISITGMNGKTRSFDLFKSSRYGDFSQDPYLRPGDMITVKPFSRAVSVAGAIERPGTYQLLNGEGLKDLIDVYANGITSFADTSGIELVRRMDSSSAFGDKTYLDATAIRDNRRLENYDSILIPEMSERMPVIFIEGAVNIEKAENQQSSTTSDSKFALDSSKRIPVRFFEGENYTTLIRHNAAWFSSVSDTEHAYVLRNGERIALNLDDILYNGVPTDKLTVKPNDTLIVPFKQYLANVTINGEVTKTIEKSSWPLTRLSTAIADSLTPYSSTRDITVVSVEGKKNVYDLFKYEREGDMSQNPYIRPGETVTINRLSRFVTIAGAVERPGTYQLRNGENFAKLIHYYANGLSPIADVSRIELTRYTGAKEISGNKIYLSSKDLDEDFALQNYDSIIVSQITDLLPVMFVEGAIGSKEKTEPEGSTRISVRFNKGENYASIVQKNSAWFSAVSDTANAYVIRDGSRIPLNLNPMLYDAAYRSEYFVQENDVLVVPFRQYFVSVSGAVNEPGRYPYIPDRDWRYYVDLAGGFLPSQNANEAIQIMDPEGRRHSKTDPIQPEYRIKAESNSFTYYFNQYAPIVTTVLSIITTSFTIIAATK